MNNLKQKSKIYKQNFNCVYKDHHLRHICNNYLGNINTMLKEHGIASTIIFHKEVLRFIQQSCLSQDTTLIQNNLPF
jgi:hypothetical protein